MIYTVRLRRIKNSAPWVFTEVAWSNYVFKVLSIEWEGDSYQGQYEFENARMEVTPIVPIAQSSLVDMLKSGTVFVRAIP